MRAAHGRRDWLLVGVGAQELALPLAGVLEVVPLPVVTPVPLAPEYVVGLVALRGEVLPLISLSELLGFDADDEAGSCVVVQDQGAQIAVLTSRVGEAATEPGELGEVPANVLGRELFAGAFVQGTRPLVLALDLDRVLARLRGAPGA